MRPPWAAPARRPSPGLDGADLLARLVSDQLPPISPVPAAPARPVATGAPLSARRRAAVLLAWLALMLLGGWVISRGHYTADLSAFLPDKPDARQQLLIEQLNSGVVARTLLLAIDGGEAPARADASKALAAKLRASGRFDTVQNGETGDWQGEGGAGDWLVRHRYHLSPAVSPEHFSATGLRSAIDDTLSLLGTPAGALVKPLLARDPTGDTQRIVESLIPGSAPRSQLGVWMSRDKPRALLLLQSAAAGSDLDGQAAVLARLRADWDVVQASQPAFKGLAMLVSGTPVFSVDSRASIEGEIRHLAIAGTVVMGALLLLAFGSPVALAVAFLPVASGVVAGICAVSLGFGTVHGMTLGFGSTLIGEAVDYAIYFLIQARGAVQRGEATAGNGWRAFLAQSWPTVRLGLLTSVFGFAALLMSGFPGLAQLGVFSLAGLVAAALATRWVLPVLMPDGAAGLGLRRWLGQGAAWALRGLPRLRWPLALAGLAVVVMLVVQRGDLWRGDLMSLSPVPRAALLLDAELRAELSAGESRTLVVVLGTDAEATLQAAEAAGSRLDALVAKGRLAGYDSPARFLPSQRTQQARLAALPGANTLQANLATALQGLPLQAERLAPFVAEVQTARSLPLVTQASLAGSPLKSVVEAMLMPRSAANGWLALLPLQPGSDASSGTARPTPDITEVRAALADLPGAQVIEIKTELDGLYARYLREALWQSALGALGVVALLALALRSGRRLLAVCQPLLLAVLLTLGGLALAGVPLGILHLVGLLLVVAVGSNYALFFDQLMQRQQAPDADTLASLLLANITTVLSFGLIAVSKISALAAIGQVVAPGALLALLLSAAFVARRPAGAAVGAAGSPAAAAQRVPAPDRV